MRIKLAGNKGDSAIITVHNAEASADIPRGTPVVYVMNGTNDSLDVVLPATAGAAKSAGFMAGVTTDTITNGKHGEAVAFGVVTYAIMTRMTRAATTDSWSSSASVQSGAILAHDTLNNGFLSVSASQNTAAQFAPFAVLMSSLASSTSSASSTSDTRTAITNSVRVFVRML